MNEWANQYVYGVDIEVFPNFHSFTAISLDHKSEHVFVLHPDSNRDDRIKYIQFLRQQQTWITFNGMKYDYPVVHQILNNVNFFLSAPLDKVVAMIYNWSTQIINDKLMVYESEHMIHQFDLFKIWHFDNKAKSASLKHIEFFLRWKDLRDMPNDPTEPIGNDQSLIADILAYNRNDVLATIEFWFETVKEGRIELRTQMLNKYGINANNTNDVSIGSELLAHFLSQDMNVSVRELKKLRTKHRQVPLSSCMPVVTFRTREFSNVYNVLRCASVRNTKLKFKKLTAVFRGVKYKYGMGGLHAATKPGIYTSNDDYSILDIDVQSYYPNMAINYNYKPAHLGDSFARIYKWMFEERSRIPKSDPINKALKLSLNGSFGRMGSSDSFLFDIKALLSITLTGQMLLTKLIEDILLTLGDCELLQANTDGATFRVHKSYIDSLMNICKTWEANTNLKLEYANYDKIAIRDVNNYCAISGDYIKTKGAFEIDKEPHKDHSARIVSIAAVLSLMKDIDVKTFISDPANHLPKSLIIGDKKSIIKLYGVFDYHLMVKAKGGPVKGKAKVYAEDVISRKREKLQKINRYYISRTSDNRLIKKFKDGSEMIVHADEDVRIVVHNKVQDEHIPDDINTKYYIQQANKLVDSVKGFGQLSLF